MLTGRFDIYARSLVTDPVIKPAERISAMFFETRVSGKVRLNPKWQVPRMLLLWQHGADPFLTCFRLFIAIRMLADRPTGCFWQDDTRLICCYAHCLNTTCTRVCTPSSVLPPCTWQRPSLFLSLSSLLLPLSLGFSPAQHRRTPLNRE